jgi:hypothetical protein
MSDDSLQSLAEDFVAKMNDGEVEFELTDLQVGVSREAAVEKFAEWVEDDLPSIDGTWEDIAEEFEAMSTNRAEELFSVPSSISDKELATWLEGTMTYDQLFCFASVFSLSDDAEGPSAIIGTQGDSASPEYELFVVSPTRAEAVAIWARDWLQ